MAICLNVYIKYFIIIISAQSMTAPSFDSLVIFTIVLVLSLLFTPAQSYDYPLDPNSSVYTIPYLTSYRQDLIDKAMGCNYQIVLSSYTHPDGIRDAAQIMLNPYQYGGVRCQPKETYLKIFGYAQDYNALTDVNSVGETLKRAINGRISNIVIDWKDTSTNLTKSVEFLDGFLKFLNDASMVAYLKVPASYFCKMNQGNFYILGLKNVKKIIVQMYGQEPTAYKNLNQIFMTQQSEQSPSQQYPEKSCPRFPSYVMLKRAYPNIEFYIEKTLQQEEPGFIGQKFIGMLSTVAGVYDRKVFYDAYPPSIIRL